MDWRLWLRRLHLWAALSVGLPVALVALTGLPVTYWFATDALAAPAFYQPAGAGPPAALDRVIDAARHVHPGARIDGAFLNRNGGVAVVSVRLAREPLQTLEVAVDRRSLRIVGERWQNETLIGRLYGFHAHLWLGETGHSVVFGLAVATLVLLASGLGLWWPRPGRLKSALAPMLRRGRRLYDIHNKAGLYTTMLLALSAGSATVLTWPQSPHERASNDKARFSAKTSMPLQTLQDRANALDPSSSPVNIVGIDDVSAPLTIILEQPAGLFRPAKLTRLRMDRSAGGLVSATEIGSGSTSAVARSLHTGGFAGEFGRFAMALAACLPGALWGTGVGLWLTRRSRVRPVPISVPDVGDPDLAALDLLSH